MSNQLPGALADVLEKLFQWDAEFKQQKTAAELALSAAVARLRVICRKIESEPPMAFASEPATEPGRKES